MGGSHDPAEWQSEAGATGLMRQVRPAMTGRGKCDKGKYDADVDMRQARSKHQVHLRPINAEKALLSASYDWHLKKAPSPLPEIGSKLNYRSHRRRSEKKRPRSIQAGVTVM